MSTLTATHNTQDMSQWMTSGASRLRAKQNRTFASRAQQRAAAASSAVSYSHSSTSRMPTSSRQPQGGRRIRMAAGETITLKSKNQQRRGGASLNGVPQSMSSRAFASIEHQGNHHEGHNVMGNRKSMEFLPSSGAMPASRNPFRMNNRRPVNENPFDAAMQAVEDTRSRAEEQMSSPFGSHFSHSSTLTPTSLSLKGDKIMRLLAANQNGSVASPSSLTHLSRMAAANRKPFAFSSEKIVNHSPGSLFPSRGIKLPQRRMAPEHKSDGFLFDTPTVVDVPSALCFRRNVLPPKSQLIPSRSLKRTSDESSYSSESSCGSRKQARRLGVMSVSDRNNGVAFGQQQQKQPSGGLERFRTRRQSGESQSSPTISQPVPAVVKTVSNKNKTAPPMRFFNNGVEVDINGNPIPPSLPPTPEPEPEVDLDTLKDHQASVWDQFIETPEAAEARIKKKKKSRRKKSASAEEETPAKPLNLQVDPTPSALSANPTKLASADVDDLVRDSLKEREKTLSAASVLLGFMGQSKSSDEQKETARV